MNASTFRHLDIATLGEWLAGDTALTLVDIRDPLSFTEGHIPGSRHLDNDGVPALLETVPRERPMVVICYHGHSSQQAAGWLAGQGFATVYSLDGGFAGWQLRYPDRVGR